MHHGRQPASNATGGSGCHELSTPPVHRSDPQGRWLVTARTYVCHGYPDGNGIFTNWVGAVVIRATMRITQQGIGGQYLSEPFIGTGIGTPRASVGVKVTQLAAVGARNLELRRARRHTENRVRVSHCLAPFQPASDWMQGWTRIGPNMRAHPLSMPFVRPTKTTTKVAMRAQSASAACQPVAILVDGTNVTAAVSTVDPSPPRRHPRCLPSLGPRKCSDR